MFSGLLSGLKVLLNSSMTLPIQKSSYYCVKRKLIIAIIIILFYLFYGFACISWRIHENNETKTPSQ